MRPFALSLCALFLTGCATSSLTAPAVGSEPITRDYQIDGASWDNGGAVMVAMRLREEQGKTAVCGGYWEDGVIGRLKGKGQEAVSVARIDADGESIIDNLRFFARLKDDTPPFGQSASCVLSPKPWKASYKNAKLDMKVSASFKF